MVIDKLANQKTQIKNVARVCQEQPLALVLSEKLDLPVVPGGKCQSYKEPGMWLF